MKDLDCVYQGCEKLAHSRFLCKVHYELWSRHTNPKRREKHNEKSRRYRRNNLKKCRKYNAAKMRESRRTKIGYLRCKYQMMRHRVLKKRRANDSWFGKPLCKKEDFLEWSLSDTSFDAVFKRWLKNQKNPKLWPSIDRINNDRGYVIGNMRWVTHSKNSQG